MEITYFHLLFKVDIILTTKFTPYYISILVDTLYARISFKCTYFTIILIIFHQINNFVYLNEVQ